MSTVSRSSRWSTRSPSRSAAGKAEQFPFLSEGPVLLALRGHESSEAAAVVAARAASAMSRELHVVSAVEPALTYSFPPLLPEATLAADDASRSANRKLLEENLSSYDLGVDYELSVELGSPVAEIAAKARQLKAALIVVGSAPRVRQDHTVAGRRAGQILQRADTPVLSVDPAMKSLPREVLVATDFSTASAHAAQLAAALVEKGGRVTLLHVVPPAGSLLPSEPIASVELREEVRRRLEELRNFVRGEASSETVMEIAIAEGDPVHEILAHATRIRADLIATGTHGRAGIGRLIMGSTAADVLHMSPCSVLASTEPDVAEAMRIELEMGQQVVSRDRDQWKTILNEFSQRNEGRRADLEVDDPAIGAQVQATGYRLAGVAYDETGRVNVMLRPAEAGETHLTRNIPGVTSVAISATRTGHDGVLELKHGQGHTLIILRD